MRPGDKVRVMVEDREGEEIRGTVIAVDFPPPARDPATGFTGLRSATVIVEVVLPE